MGFTLDLMLKVQSMYRPWDELYSQPIQHGDQIMTFDSVAAFFKVVVIICLFIKQLLFLDSGGLHQLVHSS